MGFQVIDPYFEIGQSFEEACMGFASSSAASGELVAVELQPWDTFDATFVEQTIVAASGFVIHSEEFIIESFQFRQ